jgi:hypothetical protein
LLTVANDGFRAACLSENGSPTALCENDVHHENAPSSHLSNSKPAKPGGRAEVPFMRGMFLRRFAFRSVARVLQNAPHCFLPSAVTVLVIFPTATAFVVSFFASMVGISGAVLLRSGIVLHLTLATFHESC